MKSIELLDWDGWFDRMSQETELREKTKFSNNDYAEDKRSIEIFIDKHCSGENFQEDWTFSYEFHEEHPLFWIALYDLKIVNKKILDAFIALPDNLKLDWLIRIEVYPQIRNGVKYGDPACLEIITTNKLCLATAGEEFELAGLLDVR
jgi:hypothetical protein